MRRRSSDIRGCHEAFEAMTVAADSRTLSIDFSNQGNSRGYLGPGWSDTEARWTWTSGPTSLLYLPTLPSDAGWHCKIMLMPFTHLPSLFDQRLVISISDHVVFDHRLSEATEIEFDIPGNSAVGETIAFLFKCPDATSPAMLGLGLDSRHLGFAVLNLALASTGLVCNLAVPQEEAAQSATRYGGIEDVTFIETTDITQFGRAKGHERLRIFASLHGPNQNRLFRESTFTPEFVAEHYRYEQPPEICVYALKDHVLWGNGILTSAGKFFLKDDCFPGYLNGYVAEDLHQFPEYWVGPIDRPDVTTIDVAGPIGIVVHPNIVYGHFLLELLPKLYLLNLIRDFGARFKVALSDRTPVWLHDFIALYFNDRDIIRYDMTNSSVRAPAFLVPSMMHTDHNFHPAFNLMVTDVLARAGVGSSADNHSKNRERPQTRIYLSRRRLADGWHHMLNEEDVERTMESLGFIIVHPQDLAIRDQLALYSRADVIAGQYSSALHNAMFAPIGATVISLNCINWYQSVIGRLRRHRMVFITPADGIFRTWRTRGSGDSSFRIDTTVLRETVVSVINER